MVSKKRTKLCIRRQAIDGIAYFAAGHEVVAAASEGL
jgi:hypothetical protein